jgi:hypothetical protein
MDPFAPFLLSMIICLTLPGFRGLFNIGTDTALLSTVQTTVATALAISSIGLALSSLAPAHASIVILLGILSAPVASQYAHNPLFRLMASCFMFLLYLRLGVPHAGY